jgi:hypothetical protein
MKKNTQHLSVSALFLIFIILLIEDGEVGGICSTRERHEKCVGLILAGKLQGKKSRWETSVYMGG